MIVDARWLSLPTLSTSCPKTYLTLPEEIWHRIFSELSTDDVARCSLAAIGFYQISSSYDWKSHLLKEQWYGLVDDFEPLVEEGVITWQGLRNLFPLEKLLTDFFHSCFYDSKETADHLILKYNPQLNCYPDSLLYMIPQPMVRQGNRRFIISNVTNVKMIQNGMDEVLMYEGDRVRRFTHLAIDGNFLFALRTDGVIIQWDIGLKKVVRKIRTAYTNGSIFCITEKMGMLIHCDITPPICGKDSFYVKDKTLILETEGYSFSHREEISLTNVEEVLLQVTPKKVPLKKRTFVEFCGFDGKTLFDIETGIINISCLKELVANFKPKKEEEPQEQQQMCLLS